jgi:TolB-like protein/predicted Ser/Thr protein kinase
MQDHLNAPLLDQLRASIADRYEVLRELGAGGMGWVFLGRDIALDRKVAIKVIAPQLATETNARERFLREARTVAKLRHPNIVAVHAAGDTGAILYFVMEYVEGESLRDFLARETRCDDARAGRILGDLAQALDYAHQQGVIHRDVKPENVLLDVATGRALLTDFGVARAFGAAGGDADDMRTGTGFVIGSPRYMSPEQAAGERDLDGRSDVYSLGLVGYEMYAGAAPFSGSSPMAVLTKQLTERPIPLAQRSERVPPHIAAAIDRALAKDPNERWRTAAEFAAALAGTGTATAPTAGWGTPSGATPRVHRRWPLAVGAAAIALVSAAAFSWWNGRDGVPAGVDPRKSFLVTPFEVLGGDPQHAWLREGSVSMLSLNLAQWKDLSVVGYERSLDLLRAARLDSARHIGLADAQAMARTAGVWTVVMGQVTMPGDSLLVTARLFDVASGRQLDQAQRSTGRTADPRPLFDALTRDLLDLAGAPANADIARLTETTTSSVEAYRAYLDGVRALSAWQIARADSLLAHATAVDSQFALAYYHRAMTLGWMGTGDSVHRAVVDQTARHLDRLPAREQTLARGYVDLSRALAAEISGKGGAGPLFVSAEGHYGQAIARDSSDADAWYGYADALWHHRVDGWGTPATVANWTRAYRAFQRTLAIDSTFYLAYAHTLDVLRQASGQVPGLMMQGDSLFLLDSATRARPEVTARLASSRERAFRRAVEIGRTWTRAAPSPMAYRTLFYVYVGNRMPDSGVVLLRESLGRPEARSPRVPFMIAAAQAFTSADSGLETLRDGLRTVEARQLAAEGGTDLLEILLAAGRAATLTGSVRDADAVADLAMRAVPAPATLGRRTDPLPKWWALAARVGAGMPSPALRRQVDSAIADLERMPGDFARQRRQVQAAAGLYTIYLVTHEPRHLAALQRWRVGQPALAELDALGALAAGDTARARALAMSFPSADSARAAKATVTAVRWIARAQVLEQLGDATRAIAMLDAVDPSRMSSMGFADPAPSLYPRTFLTRGALYERLGQRPQAAVAYRRYLAMTTNADSTVEPLRRAATAGLARTGDSSGIAVPARRPAGSE